MFYIDTDSFLFKFKGIDIFDEVVKRPPAEFMDLRNFDINHPSHSVANKGKLGLL